MVKTKVKYECEECGKELRNARALAGHLWFAHGKRGGEKHSLHDKLRLLEREKGVNPDTVDKIDKILEKVNGNNPATPQDVREVLTKVGSVEQKIEELIAKLSEIIRKNPHGQKLAEEKNPDEDEDEQGWFL